MSAMFNIGQLCQTSIFPKDFHMAVPQQSKGFMKATSNARQGPGPLRSWDLSDSNFQVLKKSFDCTAYHVHKNYQINPYWQEA